jgi:hypothetical protein
MTGCIGTFLASFTAPIQIDTTAASMLWLLPLVAAIAVVYKATKVHSIRPWPFIRESGVLFGSILVFIVVAALVLYLMAWIITEQLPRILGLLAF